MVKVKIGHVFRLHAVGWGSERSVVVTSKIRPVWGEGAVKALWVPVEGDGIWGKTEPGINHAWWESSHAGSPGIGWQEWSPGHEPHLVEPLLLAPLVLEPDLDHPHG